MEGAADDQLFASPRGLRHFDSAWRQSHHVRALFAVNTPDDMARLNLGGRRVTADAIEAWKAARGLDKPLFINTAAEGVQKITDTVFFERSVPLLFFDFGRSDSGRDIGYEISTRMWPSLALAVPTFLLGLIVMVAWSLLVVLFRRTRVEAAAIGLSVFLMSISSLFYIIVGQWLFSKLMRLFPIQDGRTAGDARHSWCCRC